MAPPWILSSSCSGPITPVYAQLRSAPQSAGRASYKSITAGRRLTTATPGSFLHLNSTQVLSAVLCFQQYIAAAGLQPQGRTIGCQAASVAIPKVEAVHSGLISISPVQQCLNCSSVLQEQKEQAAANDCIPADELDVFHLYRTPGMSDSAQTALLKRVRPAA